MTRNQSSPNGTQQARFEALLARNGIRRLWVIDPMHDMDAARETARRLKQAGVEKVGYMTQDASVYTDLTVAQNLRYFAALAGIPSPAKAVAAAAPGAKLVQHRVPTDGASPSLMTWGATREK